MKSGDARDEMVITGYGMMCSVGWNAATACAAIRAGLSRPTPVDGFDLLDEVASEPAPVRGHAVTGYTDGFIPPGLWNRLAGGAWLDLREQLAAAAETDPGFWQQCGLVLVTPPLDQARFQLPEPIPVEAVRATTLRYLAGEHGWSVDPAHAVLVCGGHAAGIAALARARELLTQARITRVVLLAVDSQLDPLSVEWLAEQGRLKSPEQPAGLEPGEAATALLLETAAAARRREARPKAVVSAIAVGRETGDFLGAGRQHGVEQARLLEQVSAPQAPFAGDLIADLNGEDWRAYELGAALARLTGRWQPDYRMLTPLQSTGDTGTACGGVAACLAVHGFEREWNPRGATILVGASEDGEVAAACLTAG
jgi:3-oxoacyl-[acyl-carrier-protein] synthase-1